MPFIMILLSLLPKKILCSSCRIICRRKDKRHRTCSFKRSHRKNAPFLWCRYRIGWKHLYHHSARDITWTAYRSSRRHSLPAAFFIVAGLITPDSEITIKNVGINDTRAGILKVCQDMGADITLLNTRRRRGAGC